MSVHLLVFLSVVGVALASLPLFALFGRRDVDATRKGTRFLSGGIGEFLLHWFMWAVGPAESFALRHSLTPDFFNFAGLAFGAVGGLSIGLAELEVGGWALVLGGVCDVLDGRIARARGLDSRYGRFIDSTLDRFVEAFVFFGFAVELGDFPYGPVVVAAALAGSMLVSYARARGEIVGVLCKEGLMQRAERLVLMCFVCFVDRPISDAVRWPRGTVAVWVMALIAVTTLATAVHRTVWISRRLRSGHGGR